MKLKNDTQDACFFLKGIVFLLLASYLVYAYIYTADHMFFVFSIGPLGGGHAVNKEEH